MKSALYILLAAGIFTLGCGPSEEEIARRAAEEAARAEAIRLAAREASARVAAEGFPTRQEGIEQRLSDLEGLINDEAWVTALNDGEALQRELSSLFQSAIAETPEVTAIRTRLDDALLIARREENVLRRQATERAAQVPSPRQYAIETIKSYPEVLDAAISQEG